jgi:hypothetical protein
VPGLAGIIAMGGCRRALERRLPTFDLAFVALFRPRIAQVTRRLVGLLGDVAELRCRIVDDVRCRLVGIRCLLVELGIELVEIGGVLVGLRCALIFVGALLIVRGRDGPSPLEARLSVPRRRTS